MIPAVRMCTPFGAEISDAQIATPSRVLADRVFEFLVSHRVVILRAQTGNDSDLVRFLGHFGALTFTAGEIPVAGAPDLNLVSNVGRDRPPRSVFHTDTSYIDQPPAFSALRAVVVPAAGGATLFNDQVAAAARLPASAFSWLTGRTLLHATSGQSARHPVLRRHPVTGETALFLSTPERCKALSGVDEPTSTRIVALLYARSIRPAGLLRHVWRAGDIVLWDNRTTMHRADHGNVVGDRILHRGLVAGETPLAA